MTVIRLADEKRQAEGGICAALGCFDGVHIGHEALLRETLLHAHGRRTAVWTFSDTAPGEGFKGAPALTDGADKLSLIAAAGIGEVICEDFSAVRDLSPEEFVRDVLVRRAGIKTAVCGFNFRFGKNAAGTADDLAALMKKYGGDGIAVPPVLAGGAVVSSSGIRRLLSEGDTAAAAEMLGRPFSLCLPVAEGRRFGRKMGFPTINQLLPSGRAYPADGIYCTRTEADGKSYVSVTNIGSCPTVCENGARVCETHIDGFDGDLYGKAVRVFFFKRLRGEIKFSSPCELGEQIAADCAAARSFFAAGGAADKTDTADI